MVIAGTMYIISSRLCLQVSLCDDYSLPVDFVNKRRPASAAAATSAVQWTLPSPTVENVSLTLYEELKLKPFNLFFSVRYLKFFYKWAIYFISSKFNVLLLQTSTLSYRDMRFSYGTMAYTYI